MFAKEFQKQTIFISYPIHYLAFITSDIYSGPAVHLNTLKLFFFFLRSFVYEDHRKKACGLTLPIVFTRMFEEMIFASDMLWAGC